MKRLLLCCAGIVLLAGCAGSGRHGHSRSHRSANDLEGTWECRVEASSPYRELKILNDTHFVWVTFDRATGNPVRTGGGTYGFDGTIYTETVEFAGPDLAPGIVGKTHRFLADLDGGRWRHTGILENGAPVNEVWVRVD